jgi:hypothetical protein
MRSQIGLWNIAAVSFIKRRLKLPNIVIEVSQGTGLYISHKNGLLTNQNRESMKGTSNEPQVLRTLGKDLGFESLKSRLGEQS